MSEAVRDLEIDLDGAAPAPSAPASLLRSILSTDRATLAREAIFRLAGFGATAIFAIGAAAAYRADPSRITLLALLVCECLVLVLLLFSAVPKHRDWGPASVITSWFVCIYPALVNVAPGTGLAPWQLTTSIAVLGLALNTWAKLNLGASFAILPGMRAIVASGPYRLIRHPIYAGFAITSIGFLLSDFSIHNLVLLGSVFGCELYRIGREEALLGRDPGYQDYRKTVRYRFIPGVV